MADDVSRVEQKNEGMFSNSNVGFLKTQICTEATAGVNLA